MAMTVSLARRAVRLPLIASTVAVAAWMSSPVMAVVLQDAPRGQGGQDGGGGGGGRGRGGQDGGGGGGGRGGRRGGVGGWLLGG
ncbi:MAG: hypothetical protein ACKOTD_10850, partial [Phycisphaerales bacterium]